MAKTNAKTQSAAQDDTSNVVMMAASNSANAKAAVEAKIDELANAKADGEESLFKLALQLTKWAKDKTVTAADVDWIHAHWEKRQQERLGMAEFTAMPGHKSRFKAIIGASALYLTNASVDFEDVATRCIDAHKAGRLIKRKQYALFESLYRCATLQQKSPMRALSDGDIEERVTRKESNDEKSLEAWLLKQAENLIKAPEKFGENYKPETGALVKKFVDELLKLK